MPPEADQATMGRFSARRLRGERGKMPGVRVYLRTSAKRGIGSAALPNF